MNLLVFLLIFTALSYAADNYEPFKFECPGGYHVTRIDTFTSNYLTGIKLYCSDGSESKIIGSSRGFRARNYFRKCHSVSFKLDHKGTTDIRFKPGKETKTENQFVFSNSSPLRGIAGLRYDREKIAFQPMFGTTSGRLQKRFLWFLIGLIVQVALVGGQIGMQEVNSNKEYAAEQEMLKEQQNLIDTFEKNQRIEQYDIAHGIHPGRIDLDVKTIHKIMKYNPELVNGVSKFAIPESVPTGYQSMVQPFDQQISANQKGHNPTSAADTKKMFLGT